jgi:hypothetical protein
VNAQQVPPSPSVQQSPVNNATPSTLGAAGSPLQTPRPLGANAKVKTEATGRRETNRVRSSIACSSCRRSKTKCDNDGIRDANGLLAPCRSCLASKKKCDYEMTSTSAQPPRRESTATAAGDEVCSLLTSLLASTFLQSIVLLGQAIIVCPSKHCPNITTTLSTQIATSHNAYILEVISDRGFQTHQKKRKRPAGPAATQSPYRGKSVGSLEDAHRSPLLTPKVWDELVS